MRGGDRAAARCAGAPRVRAPRRSALRAVATLTGVAVLAVWGISSQAARLPRVAAPQAPVRSAGAPAAAAPPGKPEAGPATPATPPGASAEAPTATAASGPAPAAPPWGLLPPDAAADAAAVTGPSVSLFYGAALPAESWYEADQQAFTAGVADRVFDLRTVYNQWLALADARDATYRAAGQTGADGVIVYGTAASAVLHVLDLALQAREQELLVLLGAEPPMPHLYPPFAALGYHAGGTYIQDGRVPDAMTPADVDAVVAGLPLPAALFRGVGVYLLPYGLPQEYGLTTVYGPDIRIWLGAGADIDLRHVLLHELAHALQFRFGGYDRQESGQPLSTFWQRYLRIRGLTWYQPGQGSWAQQTPECFAEDFAQAFAATDDPLGYQAACGAPSAAQRRLLLAFWLGLPKWPQPSPFQQAGWVRWLAPWVDADFGDFSGVYFTGQDSLVVRLALSADARGGPFTLESSASGSPLAALRPGAQWSGTVRLPANGSAELDADTPQLVLSSLRVYRNPAFVPIPRLSGVFRDTLDSWARAAIAVAVREGIVGGYPDGTFRPQAPVLRGEFARMLATAAQQPLPGPAVGPGPASFADVPPTAWEAPYVSAVGGELPGVGARFGPQRPLTWEEAVAWTARAFGWPTLPAQQVSAILAQYPHRAALAPADAPGFAVALAQGLVVAGPASPGPDTNIDRAQAAVLLLRAAALSAPTAGPS